MPTYTEDFTTTTKYVSGGTTGLTQMEIDTAAPGYLQLDYDEANLKYYDSGNALTLNKLNDVSGKISIANFKPSGIQHAYRSRQSKSFTGTDPTTVPTGWVTASDGTYPDNDVNNTIHHELVSGDFSSFFGDHIWSDNPADDPFYSSKLFSQWAKDVTLAATSGDELILKFEALKDPSFELSWIGPSSNSSPSYGYAVGTRYWAIQSTDDANPITAIGEDTVNDGLVGKCWRIEHSDASTTKGLRMVSVNWYNNQFNSRGVGLNAADQIKLAYRNSGQSIINYKVYGYDKIDYGLSPNRIHEIQTGQITNTDGILEDWDTLTINVDEFTTPNWVNGLILEFYFNDTTGRIRLDFDEMEIRYRTPVYQVGRIRKEFDIPLSKGWKAEIKGSGATDVNPYYEIPDDLTGLQSITNDTWKTIRWETFPHWGHDSMTELRLCMLYPTGVFFGRANNGTSTFKVRKMGPYVPWHPTRADTTTGFPATTIARQFWKATGTVNQDTVKLAPVPSGSRDYELSDYHAHFAGDSQYSIRTGHRRAEHSGKSWYFNTSKYAMKAQYDNGSIVWWYPQMKLWLNDIYLGTGMVGYVPNPSNAPTNTHQYYRNFRLIGGVNVSGHPVFMRAEQTGTDALMDRNLWVYDLGSTNPTSTGSMTRSTFYSSGSLYDHKLIDGVILPGATRTHYFWQWMNNEITDAVAKTTYGWRNRSDEVTFQDIDASATITGAVNMAVTGDRAHLLSLTTGGDVKYRQMYTGGFVVNETVVNIGSPTQYSNPLSIKLDSSGNPVVMLISGNTPYLYRRVGGTWAGGATNITTTDAKWIDFDIDNDETIFGVATSLKDVQGVWGDRHNSMIGTSDNDHVSRYGPFFAFTGTYFDTGSFTVVTTGSEFTDSRKIYSSTRYGLFHIPGNPYVWNNKRSHVWLYDTFETGVTGYSGTATKVQLTESGNNVMKVTGESGQTVLRAMSGLKTKGSHVRVRGKIKVISGGMDVSVGSNTVISISDSKSTHQWIMFDKVVSFTNSDSLTLKLTRGSSNVYIDNLQLYDGNDPSSVEDSASFTPPRNEAIWFASLPVVWWTRTINNWRLVNDTVPDKMHEGWVQMQYLSGEKGRFVYKNGSDRIYLDNESYYYDTDKQGWANLNLDEGSSVFSVPKLTTGDAYAQSKLTFQVSRNNRHYFTVEPFVEYTFDSGLETDGNADFTDTGSVDADLTTLKTRILFEQ